MSERRIVVTIVVPGVPDALASPNARCSERTSRRHRKALGNVARTAACAVYHEWNPSNSGYVLIPGQAVVDVLVRWPKGRRTMDRDNLIAALKSCFDALAWEAIIGDDKDLRIGAVDQERAPRQAEVVLTITEIAAGEERRRG